MYRGLYGALLMIWGLHVHAAELLPSRPTVPEMALLPEYCKVRLTEDQGSLEFRSWMQRLGPKFLGMHHYCNGLNNINRYLYRVADKKRGYYLSRVLPEMDYVAKDMPPDFPLAGDIYLNRGIALQLMKKDALAITDFNKAIKHDPKQIRAYLEIADIHSKTKNNVKALEIITNGLRQVPDSKRLQKRYLELGGKEPFPSPVVDPVTRTENSSVSQTNKAEPDSSVSKPDAGLAQQSAPQSVPEDDGKDAKTIERDSSSPKSAPIGVPGNPYCRFCPPE